MLDDNSIKAARQANLYDFFLSHKHKILPVSKGNYRVIGYGGLIVKDNYFYWWSGQTGGNALDCLVKVLGIPFPRAVELLTGHSIQQKITYPKTISSPSQSFTMPELHSNAHRVFAYLNKSRKISAAVITSLLKNKLLFQDHKNNCVFPNYDFNNLITGADLVGTCSNIRFKGIIGNPTGFCFKIGDPKKLFVFESPIDALSYITYHNCLSDQDSWYLSMGGLKFSILEDYTEKFSFDNVVICVDNDKEGLNGKKGKGGLDFIEFLNSINFQHILSLPDSSFKDWNDQLFNAV